MVNAPLGRVCQAILRELISAPKAIGYRWCITGGGHLHLGGVGGGLAGGLLLRHLLRYVGPPPCSAMDIMLDILLMVVKGGMGTMYAAANRATLLLVARTTCRTEWALPGAVEGCRPAGTAEPRTAGCPVAGHALFSS